MSLESLKVTSNSRSNFDPVFFSRQRCTQQLCSGIWCAHVGACLVALLNCTRLTCLQISPHHVQRRLEALPRRGLPMPAGVYSYSAYSLKLLQAFSLD